MRPRIYSRENNDAYIFTGSHIVIFESAKRKEVIRVVPDKEKPRRFYGVDGYSYQLGETTVLRSHPLYKTTTFFDADVAYNAGDSVLKTYGRHAILTIPVGSPFWVDGTEDYVSMVLFVNGTIILRGFSNRVFTADDMVGLSFVGTT